MEWDAKTGRQSITTVVCLTRNELKDRFDQLIGIYRTFLRRHGLDNCCKDSLVLFPTYREVGQALETIGLRVDQQANAVWIKNLLTPRQKLLKCHALMTRFMWRYDQAISMEPLDCDFSPYEESLHQLKAFWSSQTKPDLKHPVPLHFSQDMLWDCFSSAPQIASKTLSKNPYIKVEETELRLRELYNLMILSLDRLKAKREEDVGKTKVDLKAEFEKPGKDYVAPERSYYACFVVGLHKIDPTAFSTAPRCFKGEMNQSFKRIQAALNYSLQKATFGPPRYHSEQSEKGPKIKWTMLQPRWIHAHLEDRGNCAEEREILTKVLSEFDEVLAKEDIAGAAIFLLRKYSSETLYAVPDKVIHQIKKFLLDHPDKDTHGPCLMKCRRKHKRAPHHLIERLPEQRLRRRRVIKNRSMIQY